MQKTKQTNKKNKIFPCTFIPHFILSKMFSYLLSPLASSQQLYEGDRDRIILILCMGNLGPVKKSCFSEVGGSTEKGIHDSSPLSLSLATCQFFFLLFISDFPLFSSLSLTWFLFFSFCFNFPLPLVPALRLASDLQAAQFSLLWKSDRPTGTAPCHKRAQYLCPEQALSGCQSAEINWMRILALPSGPR